MTNKLLQSNIYAINFLSSEILQELKIVDRELMENEYLFSSKARARFKRLRLELAEQLLRTEKLIYGN